MINIWRQFTFCDNHNLQQLKDIIEFCNGKSKETEQEVACCVYPHRINHTLKSSFVVNDTSPVCQVWPWYPLSFQMEELDDVIKITLSVDAESVESRYEKDKHKPVFW